MSFDFKGLTADIRARDIKQESRKLTEKWDRTGLLKGLGDAPGHYAKSNMARLLENQAAEILKESSDTGDIKGFQNIAFPIVRRVFGGLVANELVSVQPMSLPSGLLFFLDYQFSSRKAGNNKLDWSTGGSVYGDQTSPGTENLGTGGHYYLQSSYSNRELTTAVHVQASGTATWANVGYDFELSGAVAASSIKYVDVALTASTVTTSSIDETNYKNFSISGSDTAWGTVKAVYRRHNTYNSSTGVLRVYFSGNTTTNFNNIVDHATSAGITGSYVAKSGLTVDSSGVVHSPVFESDFSTDIIPEIDIKVTSVAVTAETRKLKAKWTPELAQDLNAYHNLDAEVELTQILSEQIALDIDREILSQLLNGATGATEYWSRKPGNFVNRLTGVDQAGGSFTGTVREWYETLVEVCIDVANTIHRKTLRGAANFMVIGPDVATIFESTVLYKPTLSLDSKETQFSLGIEKIGSLNNRFTVYKDPYFPRNKILIGYKGGSFLETGFVYAPYVPLIVTPTIFAPDDFTPRKGVMTRYAKKMVRSDFYGTVTILSMDVV